MKVYLLDSGTLLLDMSFATWNHNQGWSSASRSTPLHRPPGWQGAH